MYKQPPSEPIAIIGSGCRFAGQATSPSKLWQVLADPPDLSREVPASRFNAKAFYHEDGEYHGTTNSIKAYWLEQDHRVFDAGFFNITPKEAEAIDPQQRLLLEVVYEAMESAGYTLQQYAGKDVGVFAGVMTADYDTLSQRDELSSSQYYATGNARSIISNRVSYFFNFRGPSMTIDTACSSSLVALHQAVLSLRSGEISMACVTGVNLMITPEQFIVESSLHMLSPTGKSRMWDQSADGYARGEGVAAIFLKPLSTALHDGDEIMGLIRQTGVNSDGRTPGITMPNPDAQASLIRSTYRTSGLNPEVAEDRCQYFEAHGTGTQAGDPREAQAIYEAFFRSETTSTVPAKMLVGSVKTVIGHTEGAAGLAGVLKVLQAMKNGKVPPNLHLENLNRSVRPYYDNLEIPTIAVPWPKPRNGQPMRASVNSFGFGGTNSHAIIESYESDIHNVSAAEFSTLPTKQIQNVAGAEESSLVLTTILPLMFSASSHKSLRGVVSSWRDFLVQNPEVPLQQLAWNLMRHRSAMPYRLSIIAASRTHAVELLNAIISRASDGTEVGLRSYTSTRRPRVLAIFTGQGAQWPTMSRQLLLSNSRYRRTIQQLDEVLQQAPNPPSWSLEQQIVAEVAESRTHEAAVSQPLCTALQIGLVDLLESLNVDFQAVVGHSSGEIAAAYAAKRLSARDAILISYYRGLYAHLAGGDEGQKGGMLAAGLSESEALGFCRDPIFAGNICIAASNAPQSVTLSGDLDMIQLAKEKLTDQARFARLLQVDTAYHSPHMMRPALAYTEALQKCGISPLPEANHTHWVSSVYGFSRNSEKDLASGYWKDNMVYAVQFYDAVQVALTDFGPFDCAMEIGPHPALKSPVTQTGKSVLGEALPYYGLLDRAKDDRLAFSELIGSMCCQFGPSALDVGQYILQSSEPALLDTRLTNMPFYHWDHSQTHYRESRISRQYHFKHARPHELLGSRTRDDTEFELRWRNILQANKLPWLQGHSFQGQALVPASAYCVMALDAALQILNGRTASIIEIKDLDIMSGISMETDSVGTEILFSLKVLDQSRDQKTASQMTASFSITSCPVDGRVPMKKNASGMLLIVLDKVHVDALPRRAASKSETLSASIDGFYKMMDDAGLVYTGPFKALQSIQRRCDFASTTLRRRHPKDTTQLSISPATLDSCLQSAFLTYSSPGDKSLWTSFLPTRIARIQFNIALCLQVYQPEDQSLLIVDSHLTNIHGSTLDSKAEFTTEVCIYNERGEMEIEIEGLTVAAFAKTRLEEDYELYLHTVMNIDPTDEVVIPDIKDTERNLPELVEVCDRIAAFYSNNQHDKNDHGIFNIPMLSTKPSLDTKRTYPNDTLDSINRLVTQSSFRDSLALLQNLGRIMPELLPSTLPIVVKEASMQLHLGRHVQRIVDQICHRYPRMSVLTLEDSSASSGMTDYVLQGLGSSFLSLTRVDVGANQQQHHLDAESQAKIRHECLDLHEDISAQLEALGRRDLIIMAASVLRATDADTMMRSLRASMTDGGFLILVEVAESSLRRGLRLLFEQPSVGNQEFYPPPTQNLLEACGFVSVARNSDQTLAPGVSISIRQAGAPFLSHITRPLASSLMTPAEKVFIVGTVGETNSKLAQDLKSRISQFCGSVALATSIEGLESSTLEDSTSAIILEDLENPVVSNMTEKKLSQLKELCRPNMTVLWVTRNARSDDPEHAATFGFTRTVAAEVPNFNLQVVDLEDADSADSLLAETFMRLIAPGPSDEASLWIQEPEVYMENGRRLIPRVLPLKGSNDRINSLRRVVTKPINTINEHVQIVATLSAAGPLEYTAHASTVDSQLLFGTESTTLRVLYSTLEAVKLGPGLFVHICLGQDVSTCEMKLALSAINSSYLEVPAAQTKLVPGNGLTGPQLLHRLVRCLTALSIAKQHIPGSNRRIVYIDADHLLLEYMKTIAVTEDLQLSSWTTGLPNDSSNVQIHARSSDRQIKALIPPMGAEIYDFSTEVELSLRLKRQLPANCDYHPRADVLFGKPASISKATELSTEALSIFDDAVASVAGSSNPSRSNFAQTCSVSEVTAAVLPSMFNVIDWGTERKTTEIIKPIIEQRLFSPDKTYILVGLTRDFGQSLSRLFIQHGARHIVLASRNPDMAPKWVEELSQSYDAHVVMEKLDVTQLEDVLRLKERIAQRGMAPAGGVINGAMVLDDRVFSQMTLGTWNRTLRPKTVGSKNLDIAFLNSELEFFIMTSSFAAIGGHPGQSNYAAANMYMNGLAANRRKRGLTGSVLNIGVIYGLGLLQREKEELYIGLEREGYPPISERDIHHMFLEAIVAGRPGTGEPFDITTGLKRFKWGSANPLHWHLDPRFNHFTVNDDSAASSSEVEAQRSLLDQLSSTTDLEAMTDQLVAAFSGHLKVMLQLPDGSVNRHSSLAEIGIDSLVAVDIRNWVWKTLGRDVAVLKILGASSIHQCEFYNPGRAPCLSTH